MMLEDPIEKPGTFAATSREADALRWILRHLEEIGYRFITPTPATHARVLARRPDRLGTSPEDVLGWNLPFAVGTLDPALEDMLVEANVLVHEGAGRFRARIRVSTVHDRLFIHSAFPTTQEDSVFLGPDSYRFADLIRRELTAAPPPLGSTVLDIGVGAGVGAIVAGGLIDNATVIGTDLNPQALALTAINAAHVGQPIQLLQGRDLAGFSGGLDIALANPPYVIDPLARTYRNGGGMHGGEVSVAMTKAALDALKPGGRFILYTGSAIVNGVDELEAELRRMANGRFDLLYDELDPDVFGEELDGPGYEDVDRIAVVAAVLERTG